MTAGMVPVPTTGSDMACVSRLTRGHNRFHRGGEAPWPSGREISQGCRNSGQSVMAAPAIRPGSGARDSQSPGAQHLDHAVLAGKVTGTDRDEKRAGFIGHQLLDLADPVAVALNNQGLVDLL